jgi:hypothetical protein
MTETDADGPAYVGPRVVDVGRRSELNRHTGPNGWFAGPVSAPDRFQLLGPGLGGGEGITWRARYRGTESTALALAVKQLRRPPGARFDWPGPADRQRWDEQRDLLQYLAVDHLASVLDIFVGCAPHVEGEAPSADAPPDTPYVVMEWVPGRTLVDEFGGIPATSSTLGIRLTHLQHVAEALHSVHSRTAYGTIGTPALLRDVKPDNCVLDPARGVVLVDVGTMRLVDDGYEHPGFHHPGYTAPEVLDDPLAPREASADLYSLGALAYFCVLGEDPPPLVGRAGAGQQIGRQLLAAARSARVADPHGFVDHLRLMLHPQPDERPADADAWAQRLRALAARRGRFSTAGTRVAVAASIAIVGGLALSATALREGLTTAVDPDPGPIAASLEPEVLTTAAIPAPLVKITAPANSGDAKPCELIEGTTAALPQGTTLVLSARDLSGRTAAERRRRLSPVDGWQTPSSLAVWRTPQRFEASRSISVTGTYRHRFKVDVLVVNLEALRRVIAQSRTDGKDWRTAELPGPAVVGDSVTFDRVPGTCSTP